MGAFLAMSGQMRNLMRLSALLLAGLTLSACGNEEAPGGLVGTVGTTLVERLRGSEKPVDARRELTPERLASSPTSVLLIVVEKTDTGYTALPVAAGAGTVQWIDGTGGGLLTRDGVLVGTRGFGFDLMQAEVAPLRAALAAGGGRGLVRVEYRLNGAAERVRERFLCDLVATGGQTLAFFGKGYATRVFEERCAGATRSFVNRYWLDQGGGMRQSAVDLGPAAGVLRLSRIVD